MAHFAQVINNKVVRVLKAEQEFIDSYDDGINEGEWIQTSYNTKGGKHYSSETGLEDDKPPLRKNYAGIDFTYDKENDAFIPPKPYPSFVLNETTFRYEPPIPYPEGMPGGFHRYIWNEEYYQAEGKWEDLWETVKSYFNPESEYYDPHAEWVNPDETPQEW